MLRTQHAHDCDCGGNSACALGSWYVLSKRGGGSTGAEVTTASGLKYVELAEGTGATPQRGQTVTVHYTGTLTNGKKFDSSVDRGVPAEYKIGVGEVIKGWDEGIMSMKVGGKRKLTIPATLVTDKWAGLPHIPPNSTLAFRRRATRREITVRGTLPPSADWLEF